MPSPSLTILVQNALDTLNTVRLQLINLQQALLAPAEPSAPESPSPTLLVLGGLGPSSITDSVANTWTLQPTGPSSTPTIHLNGYPDPFTSPATLALYLSSTLYFQKITGQWYQWATNHWLPSTDPRAPSAPEWGPPARRSTEAIDWSWIPPSLTVNLDLLSDLFNDTSPRALTFLPSPIPLVTRPRGIYSSTSPPPVYQRSDNTFLLPITGPTTPVTFQFPGLRPSYIRLWDAIYQPSQSRIAPPTPIRVATGTDTIAVPSSRGSLHIIELSLG